VLEHHKRTLEKQRKKWKNWPREKLEARLENIVKRLATMKKKQWAPWNWQYQYLQEEGSRLRKYLATRG
jgi:hypothetical protein